ncbi:MAG: hypothetical protein PUC29_05615 [Clostridia bacterium]|nr:hypothetical protein [Clostridia bacterium]
MSLILCKMCGCGAVTAQSGIYICRSCGAKHSAEEIKADAARSPASWKAHFYSVYYQAADCKNDEIEITAKKLTDCLPSVFCLLKDNVSDSKDVKNALDEITSRLIYTANELYGTSEKYCMQTVQNSASDRANLTAAEQIVFTCGNLISQMLGEEFEAAFSVPCWKAGVALERKKYGKYADKLGNITPYIQKIRKYERRFEKGKDCFIDRILKRLRRKGVANTPYKDK